MLRNFYIHIGCGKTGSSALQVWLWNNSKILEGAGFKYPVFGRDKVGDYEITSGNGVFLINELREGRIRKFFDKYLKDVSGNIIFSSEAFQSVEDFRLNQLIEVVEEHGFKPVVVAYVRDVYDIAYSSYVQQVKRHGFSEGFREFCLARDTLQQFSVVRRYSSLFDDVRLIHYETALKNGIDLAFQEVVGFSIEERISKRKVNRSLTALEVEAMRVFNEVSSRLGLPERIGARVSDALIAMSPEKETDLVFDEDVLRHLDKSCGDDLTFVNRLLASGKVSVFVKEGKNILSASANIEADVADTMKSTFEVMGRILLQDQQSIENPPVSESADLVKILLKEAAKRERESPEDALQMLLAAKVIRKNGPVINERIKSCREKIGNVN